MVDEVFLLKEQGALDKAKTEIDANVAEPKLSGKSKTWYTKGQIYEAIALDPKLNTLDSTSYNSSRLLNDSNCRRGTTWLRMQI